MTWKILSKEWEIREIKWQRTIESKSCRMLSSEQEGFMAHLTAWLPITQRGSSPKIYQGDHDWRSEFGMNCHNLNKLP